MNELISALIPPIITAVISGIFAVIASLYQGAGTEALKKYASRRKGAPPAKTTGIPPHNAGKKQITKPVAIIAGLICTISLVYSAVTYARLNKTSALSADENEAYLWYLEQVQDNESPKPAHLNALGECYFYGRGTDINYDSAFSYFQEAAKAGDSNARYNLGVCYSYGYGTDIDDAKALEYFELAEEDNADAMAYVGYYYYRGWGGLEADTEKALERYRLAQKDGSVISLVFQALYYINQEDPETYQEQAVALCQQAVDSGYEKGYGFLGLCYFNSSPVGDYGKAYDYYERGAKAGSDLALYGLGALLPAGGYRRSRRCRSHRILPTGRRAREPQCQLLSGRVLLRRRRNKSGL